MRSFLIKTLLYISFLFTCFAISKQTCTAQTWVWAQKMGNTKSDKATCIKTDSSGFIYVSGYFSNSITLGTNQLVLNFAHNIQSKEAFVAKFDSTGYCYWANSGGQHYDDRVLGMDVDAEGNSVITGTFWEGAGIHFAGNYITGSAFGGGDQCFIVKHDKNGNYLWGQFVCSNSGDDQGLDIATDKAGNSYIVGFMGGNTLYCGGNVITATNTNTNGKQHSYWLAKINSAGQFQWAKCFGNLPYDTTTSKYIERDIAVCVDDSGGVFVTGGYDHTWPFGTTTLTSSGGYDLFVMKYDSSGNFHWVTGGGSDKDDWSNGICSDKKGYLYVAGEHRDSLIMDTVIVKNYNKRDAFLLKIDAQTGKPVWGKRAGSDLGGERANDVWADSMCNVYVCGDINEGAKFGDNIITGTGKYEESFVAKISPDGKWQWAITGGGLDSNDRANAVTKGKGAQIYVCGFFRAPATFGNTSLTSVGSSDAFWARVHDSSLNQGAQFILPKPTDSILCKNDTIVLNIPSHAYLQYAPLQGVSTDATQSVLRFSPDSTTTYTLSGFSKGLCPDYDTITFTIYRSKQPHAEFSVNPTIQSILTPTFTLNNLSTNANSFAWYYNNNLVSNNVNTTQTFDSAGVYCFTLFAYNDDGCMDSITHCGTIYKKEEVFFPNAFSPNGDQNNDFFGPVMHNINLNDVKDYLFMVYDRWGTLMFESNDPQYKWNGANKNNVKSDMGVYYYFCKFTTPLGVVYDKKGDVTLVR